MRVMLGWLSITWLLVRVRWLLTSLRRLLQCHRLRYSRRLAFSFESCKGRPKTRRPFLDPISLRFRCRISSSIGTWKSFDPRVMPSQGRLLQNLPPVLKTVLQWFPEPSKIWPAHRKTPKIRHIFASSSSWMTLQSALYSQFLQSSAISPWRGRNQRKRSQPESILLQCLGALVIHRSGPQGHPDTIASAGQLLLAICRPQSALMRKPLTQADSGRTSSESWLLSSRTPGWTRLTRGTDWFFCWSQAF